MPTNDVKEAATEFVVEYLQREVEFIDVAEFLDEWDIDMANANLYANVHSEVTAILDTILQRWLDDE